MMLSCPSASGTDHPKVLFVTVIYACLGPRFTSRDLTSSTFLRSHSMMRSLTWQVLKGLTEYQTGVPTLKTSPQRASLSALTSDLATLNAALMRVRHSQIVQKALTPTGGIEMRTLHGSSEGKDECVEITSSVTASPWGCAQIQECDERTIADPRMLPPQLPPLFRQQGYF